MFGAPGGVILVSSACRSGSNGGSSGAMRGAVSMASPFGCATESVAISDSIATHSVAPVTAATKAALELPPMTTSPLPGRAVRGSRTGRPVMALLDLLGRRGTLRVLWELRDGHGQSFRLLRDSADAISPSV